MIAIDTHLIYPLLDMICKKGGNIMFDDELLSEIVKLLYENDNKMQRKNLRKETGLEYIDFLTYISKLKELGYIKRVRSSQIKYHRNIYLTNKGKKLAKQ